MRPANFFFAITITVLLTLMPSSRSVACGWWGDGDASDTDDAIEVDAHGNPVEQPLYFRSMKLPGKMGYGIAIPTPDRAMPYLLATFGRPVNRIDELKSFGFRSVIDLGTPESTAHLHRAETKAIGMGYFNIPIEGDMPTDKQVDIFSQIVTAPGNSPLLVYAPRTQLLGVMWTSYRLSLGTPVEFAISEGRTLGLSDKQETELQNRKHRMGTKKSTD